MSDDVDAQLVAAHRREAALAGVLQAVGDAGDDLDAVLFAIDDPIGQPGCRVG